MTTMTTMSGFPKVSLTRAREESYGKAVIPVMPVMYRSGSGRPRLLASGGPIPRLLVLNLEADSHSTVKNKDLCPSLRSSCCGGVA